MHKPLAMVLAEDPELAKTLPSAQQDAAQRACVATTVSARPGLCDATIEALQPPDGLGLLVLEGLVASRVVISGRPSAELLGRGDVLRSWGPSHSMIELGRTWRVIEELRLAVLDRSFAERASCYPQIAVALTGRVLQRARRMTIAIAIAQHPRIDDRVLLLLWHLASRYGTPAPDGVRLSLPLSHGTLAELAAARRPSVSTALTRLARRGLVSPRSPGWMLHGECPEDLRALGGPSRALQPQLMLAGAATEH
jgi:CRP/FNR family cyclic AMP-dependent transcriptional regulator